MFVFRTTLNQIRSTHQRRATWPPSPTTRRTVWIRCSRRPAASVASADSAACAPAPSSHPTASGRTPSAQWWTSRISTKCPAHPWCCPTSTLSTVPYCRGWTLFSSRWATRRAPRTVRRSSSAQCTRCQLNMRRSATSSRHSSAGDIQFLIIYRNYFSHKEGIFNRQRREWTILVCIYWWQITIVYLNNILVWVTTPTLL